MSVSITVTVQSNSDIGNTQLIDRTKTYAEKVLGWTEQIPDPNFVQSEDPEEQVETPLVDNPVSFMQAVYGDFPTNKVNQWAVEEEGKTAASGAMVAKAEEVSSVSVSVVTE